MLFISKQWIFYIINGRYLQNRYQIVGTEKVAEQHIFLQNALNAVVLRVICNSLKVAVSPIAHLTIDPDLQKQQKMEGIRN